MQCPFLEECERPGEWACAQVVIKSQDEAGAAGLADSDALRAAAQALRLSPLPSATTDRPPLQMHGSTSSESPGVRLNQPVLMSSP